MKLKDKLIIARCEGIRIWCNSKIEYIEKKIKEDRFTTTERKNQLKMLRDGVALADKTELEIRRKNDKNNNGDCEK